MKNFTFPSNSDKLKVKSEKLKVISSLITLFKFALLIFTFSLLTFNLSAQTSDKIGDNPGNKQSSAVLELESTNKGFLLPRMTPAQMAAISNPAVGLQIYNTTDSCIYVYRGVSGWYATCGGFNAWSLFGNTGINPATQFLGTTDGQPVILKTNGTERIRFDAAGAITQTGTGVVTFTGNTKATNGLDVTNAALTANAGATITGPVAGGGTVNINTIGANTTNIGTAISTTNLNGANLNILALPAGSTSTDALVAVNRSTGKADTLNIANLVSTGITADNGLTKTGSNIQLGGTLIQATSIAQAGNSLSISGTGGATNINASGSSPTNVGNVSSTTTVLGATNVNTTGAAATTIGNSGSAVTIAGTTSVTGTTTINTTGTSNTSIGNATGTITALGATNINSTGTAATSIGNASSATTVNGTNLTIATLPSGVTTDSLVSVNNATGAVRKLKIADVVGGAITADNGLNKSSANNVQLGGPLTKNTSIDQSTFSLTINGTGTGATNIGNASSSVVLAGTTSVTGPTTINTSGTANTTIGNTTGTNTVTGNNLIISNLPSGVTNDSLVSVNNATGAVRKLKIADVVGSAITADNGLTKSTANNIQLGGTLLKAIAIAQAGFDVNYSGGNVAIGSASAPNSTLQVTGSMAVSYKIVTANRTLDATDQVVLGDATSGAITLTLPTPSASIAGRIYTVGKYDETTNLVNFSPSVYVTKTTAVPSVNFPKKYRVICDGSNWILFTE